MTSETTYPTMTIEHLGDEATAEDLADFKAACERLVHLDAEEATEFVWNGGSIRFNADTCIYCEQPVADTTIVPAADDDDAWAELAAEHAADCDWFITRAHRLAA